MKPGGVDAAGLRARAGIIYLTGFMASGKSTMGPIVANSIGYEFVDLDKLLEQREGARIADLFKNKGEEYFRRKESELLQELEGRSNLVVSLGGGAILRRENLDRIKRTGLLIYLKADPEQLLRRLRHKADRPVLKGEQGEQLDESGLRKRIETLLEERKEYYEEADFAVPTDGIHLGRTVDSIVKVLSPYLP